MLLQLSSQGFILLPVLCIVAQAPHLKPDPTTSLSAAREQATNKRPVSICVHDRTGAIMHAACCILGLRHSNWAVQTSKGCGHVVISVLSEFAHILLVLISAGVCVVRPRALASSGEPARMVLAMNPAAAARVLLYACR